MASSSSAVDDAQPAASDEEASYEQCVSDLQHLLCPQWWTNYPSGERDDSKRPWYTKTSVRQRSLEQLATAVERLIEDDGSETATATATAALLVHQLLTSPKQTALTQAEAIHCASALHGICAWQPRKTSEACGGELERWAITRLDVLHGANTERAAQLELLLVELLGATCNADAGLGHLRAVADAPKVLGRLRDDEIVGERVKRLLRVFGSSEADRSSGVGEPRPQLSLTDANGNPVKALYV